MNLTMTSCHDVTGMMVKKCRGNHPQMATSFSYFQIYELLQVRQINNINNPISGYECV